MHRLENCWVPVSVTVSRSPNYGHRYTSCLFSQYTPAKEFLSTFACAWLDSSVFSVLHLPQSFSSTYVWTSPTGWYTVQATYLSFREFLEFFWLCLTWWYICFFSNNELVRELLRTCGWVLLGGILVIILNYVLCREFLKSLNCLWLCLTSR